MSERERESNERERARSLGREREGERSERARQSVRVQGRLGQRRGAVSHWKRCGDGGGSWDSGLISAFVIFDFDFTVCNFVFSYTWDCRWLLRQIMNILTVRMTNPVGLKDSCSPSVHQFKRM